MLSALKFIAVTAEKIGVEAVDIELNVTFQGSWSQVINQTPGGSKETVLQLQDPIPESEFNLCLFELCVTNMDSETSRILLASITITDLAGAVLGSIPVWPQNLWLGKVPGATSRVNLGNL